MDTIIKTKNYRNKKKGFALLFAVVISSIILAIALGVSNIAYKEVIFSTSAKDANDAFYAADTAAECTLFYDDPNIADPAENSFTGTGTMRCNNENIDILDEHPVWTFSLFNLGNGKACANVTLNKIDFPEVTTIISVGYNNGNKNIIGACEPTVTSVQRVLELNY